MQGSGAGLIVLSLRKAMQLGCGGVQRATKMRDELSLASEGAGSGAILTVVAAVSSGRRGLVCEVSDEVLSRTAFLSRPRIEMSAARSPDEFPDYLATRQARRAGALLGDGPKLPARGANVNKTGPT